MENCSESITGLRFAWSRVISDIISGTMSQNMIGLKSVRLRGSRTFAWSAKPRGNIPMRVTPLRYVQSNQSEYFYNTSSRIWRTRLQEWRWIFGITLASSFFQKDIIHLTPCKSSTYNDGQELRIGDPEYSDIRKWEVPKFSAGMCRANLGCEGGSPMTIAYQCSGEKCLAVRKTGMTPMKKTQGFSRGPHWKWPVPYPA